MSLPPRHQDTKTRIRPLGVLVVNSPSRSALRPQQDALERIEVRLRILELRQQPFAISSEESRPQVFGKAALVVGQQRPLHPLDPLVARRQHVAVHLYPHATGTTDA